MEVKDGVLRKVCYEDIEFLNNNPQEFWKGVTSIGEEAFSCSYYLRKIKIPNSVTKIEEDAFSNCKNLTEIEIPESVTSIGKSAFSNCGKLTKVKIPNSITKIEEKTFDGCEKLTEIDIPESITSIGNDAFAHCENLTKVKIPNSVTSIGSYAFYECEKLAEIKIPDSVTIIGNGAFAHCENLTKVKMSNSITSIEESTFEFCLKLTEIEIPENVTVIGDEAFRNCRSLTKIKIPKKLSTMGHSVFRYCESLEKTELPKSLTSIKKFTFAGCENLKEVNIPENVKCIEEQAFAECKSLEKIELPEKVEEIFNSAFVKCINLKQINIPKNVKDIGIIAFARCESLEKIELPEGLTKIDGNTFCDCTSLKEIIIPESVTVIGDEAFHNCSNLKEIKIPKNVTTVEDGAFSGVNYVNYNNKKFIGDLFSPKLFEYVKENPNINTKQLNSIFMLAKENGLTVMNFREFVSLCVNLGILEPQTTKIKTGKDKNGNDVMTPVSNIVYTFMQGLIKNKQIDLNELFTVLKDMKIDGYNEAFTKFVVNKSNWSDIRQNMAIFNKIHDWFTFRAQLDLNNNNTLLPTSEKDRFKVLVYETAENGIDKLRWKVPTMEYLLKEFDEVKFLGVKNERDKQIAQEISKYKIYNQKHFDKAKEIDEERASYDVQDILKNPVKQGRIESLDQYREKLQKLHKQILGDCSEILNMQIENIENTSSVFTYEVLQKNALENFTIGCLTSCCATLYGAGAGAMRGMIIHPDMQPLVIRDFDNNIVSFGIIYVNRKNGYAVINNFEVNKKYEDVYIRNAIYNKAMEGVTAFVDEYNKENSSNPIKRVTCGLSPNWDALNNFIKENPESEILDAPNFDLFKYAGSGSWSGDWYKNQYEIYNQELSYDK